MNFKNWLSEETNPAELIASPETRPSKYGTWLMKEGKYTLITSDETIGLVTASVDAKFDLTTERVFIDLVTTLVVNEEEKEPCSKKVEKPRTALKHKDKSKTTKELDKDIDEALDAAVDKRIVKEAEINESIIGGILVGLASALVPASPNLYKLAVEKGLAGKENSRFRKYDDKDAIFNELSEMPISEIQKLLKDSSKMDAFVDRVINQVKKDMPLPMSHIPSVKAEIYKTIEQTLRRVAEFKTSKGKAETPVNTQKEFKTPISTGRHVGGVFLGSQR